MRETDLQLAHLVSCCIFYLSANLSALPDYYFLSTYTKSSAYREHSVSKLNSCGWGRTFPLQLICHDSLYNLRPLLISCTLIHLLPGLVSQYPWSSPWQSQPGLSPLAFLPAGLVQKLQRMLFFILSPLFFLDWLWFKNVPIIPLDQLFSLYSLLLITVRWKMRNPIILVN